MSYMKHLFTFLFLFVVVINSYAQRNVILIIADDLGMDYCGFYENHIDTCNMPNVRRLLGKGVRFKNAWSNPLCSPTRAGILTGRYSFRTGVGNAVGGPGSAVLDTAEVSIPRLLNIYKPNGIAKANIGKWHLHLSTPNANYNFPYILGYDRYEGCFSGVLSSYTNWTKITNGVAANNTNYATTETANNAIDWVKTQNNPFFLWLAFNAPHTPFHLPPIGLHSYTSLSGTAADINTNPKLYFKAAVEAMDHEIGRLFDSLQAFQKWDSTDIIFIGDNGNDALVAQNTGGAKGSVYQEGVNVPFIISGPSVVNPMRSSEALVNTQDLFATVIELFGYTNWATQIPANKPVDSKSLLPIIKNTAVDIRPWAFTEVFKVPTVAGDGKAMRNKDYKLIDFDNGTQKFYKVVTDPLENTDLLKGTLSADAIVNYNYLCNEMTTLIGSGSFCNYSIGISGIENVNQSIVIFPNPSNSIITFDFSLEQTNTTIKITNILGQEIKTITFTGKQLTIDKGNMEAGIYCVQFTDEKDNIVNKKIIIQ